MTQILLKLSPYQRVISIFLIMTQILLKLSPYQRVISIFLISSLQQILTYLILVVVCWLYPLLYF